MEVLENTENDLQIDHRIIDCCVIALTHKVQNLRTCYTTKPVNTGMFMNFPWRTGEVVSYKDTYQIRPLVTAGAAWHNDLVTLTADGDLTETKGFKSEDTSQYVGVGAEVTPLSWLAVRAGYRADMKGNDSNVFTGGVGFAPFNTVHVDLMGLYGEDETWGAGAQLSMTF